MRQAVCICRRRVSDLAEKSGGTVPEAMSEVCLFHSYDGAAIFISNIWQRGRIPVL